MNMSTVLHLHVTGVNTLRKARVMFDLRALGRYRRTLDIGHDLHGVRVAHRQHRDRHGQAIHIQIVNRLARTGSGPAF